MIQKPTFLPYNPYRISQERKCRRESLNFIEWSIEGLARSNFIRLYIPLYGLFGVLYNILKGCRRRRNVSCGNVANIRVRSVIVEGTNTLEES